MIPTYDNIVKRDYTIREQNSVKDEIKITFIKTPKVEILGFSGKKYQVQFIDGDTNEVVYQLQMGPNQWATCNRQWCCNWLIKITDEYGHVNIEHVFNPEGKRVYLHLDSKSLGDTLAWFPFVEEFRKKYNCTMICSTFWNDLFKKNYPEITFVNPGTQVFNLYAMYEVGWFSNTERHKNKKDPRLCSLQEIATDCLYLEQKEIIPNIYIKDKTRKIKEKYVCIAMASTAQAKYWNNPTGWQDVVDHLNSIGYKVVVTQTESTDLKNVVAKTGKRDIQETMNYLLHSDFVIGISSGISWVAWALNKPVILISGFTKPLTEFKTNIIRIINENVCHGCMNDSEQSFNKGDWNWCPRLKDTDRQFECTKQISSKVVIESITKLINNSNEVLEKNDSIYYCQNWEGEIKPLNLEKLSENFLWSKLWDKQYPATSVGTYYEIFMAKDYQRGGVEVQSGDIVVDIGANVGIFARYANSMGASKVYCFEPELKNFKCLTKNAANNVIPRNASVSNKKGMIDLYLDRTDGGHSLINTTFNNTKLGTVQPTECITLDDIFDMVPKIDYLKIDTEGSEVDIFDNVNMDRVSQIRNIAIEYHNMIFDFDDNKRTQFIQRFVDIGFYYFLYFTDPSNHLQIIYLRK